MGRILENWRIPAATLFSVALIIGTYALARNITSPPAAEASAETALLKAIATKDSDNDGLPDWEESLYGTDPHNSDSFHLGMTDGEAVARGLVVPKAIADITVATSSPDASAIVDSSLPPAPADDTLTAAFSKNFITLYLAAKEQNGGTALSESDITAISHEALNSLSSAIAAAPDFKSVNDIAVSGSGPDALKNFAIKAEAVLLKNMSNATTSEIQYLTYAVQNNDTTALLHIVSLAKAYRDSAVGLAILSVPQELAATDLALVNALMRISEITTDFTRVNTDPLATILALNQYPQAVLALENAFIHIGTDYKTAGIFLPAGTSGASFVNLMADVASEQAAAKKP